MSAIAAALNSIISGKNYVCCLCLQSIQDEPIRINDTVVIDLNIEDVAIGDVFYSLFDEQIYKYCCSFNSICDECTKSAISCYKFIKMCRKNAELFKNILVGITNSFEYIMNDLHNSKSLFVALNPQDFTSKHYYDTASVLTRNIALKQFLYLDRPLKSNYPLLNTEKDNNITCIERLKKEQKGNINYIPISDILLDNNDYFSKFKCKECTKIFPTFLNLKNHFRRTHSPKKIKCPDCPKSYTSITYLKNHRKESHHSIACCECGKIFHNMHTLRLHELGHNLSLVCQDCGRVYKNKTTFQKHIKLNVCGRETRADPSEAKFTCDHCNKRYTQKVSLRVHMQYEHGNYKAHVCEWCGKKFWAQSRLRAHIVKHTKEKKFTCTICRGKFVSKESLIYHTRTHTGEKPYRCPHCEKQFLSASRRTEHMKRHHLDGMHDCDVCHSKFKSQLFLEKHKETHMISNNNFNFTHGNLVNTGYIQNNISTNLDTKTGKLSQEIWKIEGLDEHLQNAMDCEEIEIKNFHHESFNDQVPQHFLEDS